MPRAGTAGATAVNKLRRNLGGDWRITLDDQDDNHLNQPGLLLLPFGVWTPDELVKPQTRFIPGGIEPVLGEIDCVDAAQNAVQPLDGTTLGYDFLVIASATTSRSEQTPGMAAEQWCSSIFDLYTLDGTTKSAKVRSSALCSGT